MIERLKIRLKSAAAAFTDDELQEFVTTATTDYGLREGQDNRVILDLCLALAYLALATDTARYMKYTQDGETVDQSMTPGQYMDLYKLTWARVSDALPASAPQPPGLQSDTAVLAREVQEHERD